MSITNKDPADGIHSDSFRENVISKIEVTTLGKLKLEEIREQVILNKAYSTLTFEGVDMYKDVARDAVYTGQLNLLDLLLKEVKVVDEL